MIQGRLTYQLGLYLILNPPTVSHSPEPPDVFLLFVDVKNTSTVITMDESFSVLLAAGYRKMTERKPRVEKAFEQFDPDGFGYTAEIHGSRGSSTRTFVG